MASPFSLCVLDRPAVMGGYYEDRIRDFLFVSWYLGENHVVFFSMVKTTLSSFCLTLRQGKMGNWF